MRISDWSSDVCSSDLNGQRGERIGVFARPALPDAGDAEEGNVGDEARGVECLAVPLDTEFIGHDKAGVFDPSGFRFEERNLSDLWVARSEAPMCLDLLFLLPVPYHDAMTASAEPLKGVVEFNVHRSLSYVLKRRIARFHSRSSCISCLRSEEHTS